MTPAKKKSQSKNVVVTKDGVVIIDEFGKKILLSYNENNDVHAEPNLFSDSDGTEFEGFIPADEDMLSTIYLKSSPKVVLSDLYEFTGFQESVESTNILKLRQLIEKEEEDLSFTVDPSMFSKTLPIKIFLTACVRLGAQVTGFHKFLVSPKKEKPSFNSSLDVRVNSTISFDESPEEHEVLSPKYCKDEPDVSSKNIFNANVRNDLKRESVMLTPDDDDCHSGL